MTKCLRKCGAYSYRLSRRHSTLLLIVFFAVTITIILQFYSYRQQGHPHIQSRIGDFDYRPGNFLRGQLPNENQSYCNFQYGLPETLKWGYFHLHSAPELGTKGPYRVIYNAIKGRTNANNSKFNEVTYATQATPEFVYHIVEIARYWDGPISLSVFVPNYDLDITIQIMEHLCHCYPGMSKVSLHLFYPKRFPPKISYKNIGITTIEPPTVTTTNTTVEELMRMKLENYRNLNNKTRAQYIEWARKKKIERMMMRMPKQNPYRYLKFPDCSGLDAHIPTFRKHNNLMYPINVGRNVARNASTTNYFLVSDIEMVPSEGLAPKFLTMIRKLMGDKKRDEGCVFAKTIFVVPLFEVERGEEIPRDKETLVRMVAANRAMYFHQKFCSHCQRFPGLQSWLMRASPGVVENRLVVRPELRPHDFPFLPDDGPGRIQLHHQISSMPMLIARREYPYHRWEPLYFGTHKEPWYSEQLFWEGRQDKMTQMLELCLQEYRMVVLDGAFLCHAAAPKSTKRHNRAERINTQRYMKIIGKLKHKYPDRPQCKVNWGC